MDKTEPSASQASSPGQDSLEEGDKEMRPNGSQSSVVTEAEEEEEEEEEEEKLSKFLEIFCNGFHEYQQFIGYIEGTTCVLLQEIAVYILLTLI